MFDIFSAAIPVQTPRRRESGMRVGEARPVSATCAAPPPSLDFAMIFNPFPHLNPMITPNIQRLIRSAAPLWPGEGRMSAATWISPSPTCGRFCAQRKLQESGNRRRKSTIARYSLPAAQPPQA